MHQIGIIHSPYREIKDIPIQGRFKDDVEACLELKNKYENGLKDLDKFSLRYFYIIFINHIKRILQVNHFLKMMFMVSLLSAVLIDRII